MSQHVDREQRRIARLQQRLTHADRRLAFWEHNRAQIEAAHTDTRPNEDFETYYDFYLRDARATRAGIQAELDVWMLA